MKALQLIADWQPKTGYTPTEQELHSVVGVWNERRTRPIAGVIGWETLNVREESDVRGIRAEIERLVGQGSELVIEEVPHLAPDAARADRYVGIYSDFTTVVRLDGRWQPPPIGAAHRQAAGPRLGDIPGHAPIGIEARCLRVVRVSQPSDVPVRIEHHAAAAIDQRRVRCTRQR